LFARKSKEGGMKKENGKRRKRGQVFAWLLAQVKSCYMLMCGFVKDAS
jgi:hypothetical protein